MLAALLCNLSGGTPPPPAPAAEPQRFFGGPFARRRYRVTEDDDDDKRPREGVVVEESPHLESSIPVEKPKPVKPVAIDAKRLHERVIGKAFVSREIESLWRAEIKRREQEQEDELMVVLPYLL